MGIRLGYLILTCHITLIIFMTSGVIEQNCSKMKGHTDSYEDLARYILEYLILNSLE